MKLSYSPFLLLSFFAFQVFFSSKAEAQNLQNAQWRFVVNSGADFTTSIPQPATSSLNYSNPGGSYASANVSDANGNLRFYTDGINVWDANNLPMQNGYGLYGFCDLWPQQRVVIVPKPGNPNRYYIFTLGAISQYNGSPSPVGNGGIHYSVVDFICGNAQVLPGLKNIPVKNQAGQLIDYPLDPAHTEDNPVFISVESRMTSTLHRDGDKIWVSIIADFYFNHTHTKKFMNFLVTANGINGLPDGVSPTPTVEAPVISPAYSNLEYSVTCMKISPDGTKLCDGEDVVDLFNYDNLNGTISFNTRIFDPGIGAPVGYGIEFSPNSQLVYITYTPYGIIQGGFSNGFGNSMGSSVTKVPGGLYQYQIGNHVLTLIYPFSPPGKDNIITPIPTPVYTYGLQLAINNKIYVCMVTGHLGYIDLPNQPGIGCSFNPNCNPAIPSGLLLPQWVHKANISYSPPTPIKVVEVPNVQSVSPQSILYSNEWPGYSVIAYTSIDDVTLPNPDDRVIGFGLLKLDNNGNKVFNRQYKLQDKKLYVKQIMERNVGFDNYYYVLLGVKDGVTCQCNNQKILVLKIDKSNGNIAASFKVEGFNTTSFHEPVTCSFSSYSDQNILFITSYGYDETPSISNSKIYLTALDLSSGLNRVFEVYDDNNLNAILRPTQMSLESFCFNNNQYSVYPSIDLGSTYQSAVGQPLQPLYTYGGGCSGQGQSMLLNLNNGSLATANFGLSDFSYSLILSAQNTDGRFYFVHTPISGSTINSHIYYNPSFKLSSSVFEWDKPTSKSYVTGIINACPTLYCRVYYNAETHLIENNSTGQDLNIDLGSNQNIFTASIDPDFALPGIITAHKATLTSSDRNKFYYYYNLPSGCDYPVNFTEVGGTVTRAANGTKMHISNATIQITNVNIVTTPDLPINVNQICADIGGIANTQQKAGNTANSYRNTTQPVKDISRGLPNQPLTPLVSNKQFSEFKNIKEIDVLNTIGQLLKRISSSAEIEEILQGKTNGLRPGLYFVKIVYNDNSVETLKKILQ